MKISVLGMGYVGLSNAIMLSTKYDVICHDIDESKLESIEKRRSPIKDKLISEYFKNKKLNLKTSIKINSEMSQSDFIIISTPTNCHTSTNTFDTNSIDIILKKFFVILGGFIQGIYTIGGPFVLMGYKDSFSSKQELRSTMAGYFFIINSLRALFFVFLGGSYLNIVKTYYSIAFLVMLSVWIGYYVHKKIPEDLFKRLIIIAITLIGILIFFTK